MHHPSSSSTPHSRQDTYTVRQHYQGTLADLLRSSPPPRYSSNDNAMDHTGRKRSDSSFVRPQDTPRIYAEANPSDLTEPQHTRHTKIDKHNSRQTFATSVSNHQDIPVAAPVPRTVGKFLNAYHDIPPTPPPIGAFGSEPDKWEELKRKKAAISLRVQMESVLIQKAEDIKNSANFPTTHQHHVLRYVYHIITLCPTRTWLAHISITINWTFRRVEKWFKSQRHTDHETDAPANMNNLPPLRPIAVYNIPPAEKWTDDMFRKVLLKYCDMMHFKF